MREFLDYEWNQAYESGDMRVDPIVSEGIDSTVRAFYDEVTRA